MTPDEIAPLMDVRALHVLGDVLHGDPYKFFLYPGYKGRVNPDEQPDPHAVARLRGGTFGELGLAPNCGTATIRKIGEWLSQFGLSFSKTRNCQ